MLIFWYMRFDGFALNINYRSIDPAAHIKSAIDIITKQKLGSMYYTSLLNALFMEVCAPWVSVSMYYKLFILTEVVNLGLSGLVFYSILRGKMKDGFLGVSAIVIMCIYVAEYPLNNALFGFTYLGVGISIIGVLIMLTMELMKDETNPKLLIPLLSMGCLAVFECYVLFMPVVYFAIITTVFVKQYKGKCLVSKETVFLCLKIFLMPCILGIYYTFFGFLGEGVTAGSQIALEGGIYRDLFSNFVPFIPFALFGLWRMWKDKENHILRYLFLYLMAFIGVLFIGGMKGKVSSYYYYKNYYLLWLFIMLLVYYAVTLLEPKLRSYAVIAFLSWTCILGMGVLGIEDKIAFHNQMFDENKKSGSYNDILVFNYVTLQSEPYSALKCELYSYVYDELLSNGAAQVPIACYWEDDVWYQALTNQRLDGWDYLSADHVAYYAKLDEVDADYMLVLTDSAIYQDNQEYYDGLTRLYENEAGFVAKLQ